MVRPGLVPADSPLARTAAELLAHHVADGANCARCEAPFPCPPVRHAREVYIAASLDTARPGEAPATGAEQPAAAEKTEPAERVAA
jgi:hypothetical protein